MKKELIIMLMFICSSLVIAETCGTGNTTGLASYWKLDQTTGAVVDSHGNYDGTAMGSITRGSSGQVNNAFSFDRVDGNYVDLGDIYQFERTDAFSASAWVKTTDTDNIGLNVLSDGDYSGSNKAGTHFYVYNGLVIIHLNGATDSERAIVRTDTTLVNDGQWHHIGYTYDGSSSASGLNVYVDGVVPADAIIILDTLTTSMANTNNLEIGSKDGGQGVFNGSIDEVALFTEELTASEMLALYNLGNAGEPLCELSESGTIPEVNNKTMQIFVVLIIALLIGALLLRKR